MKLVIDVPDDDDDATENLVMLMQVVADQISEGFTSGRVGTMFWDLKAEPEAGA